jgi:hypothetical protein
MAVAVFLLITSSAVFLAFSARNISEKSYGFQVATASDASMTEFEAWLQYSIISDGFDSDEEDCFTNGTAELCEYNIDRLTQLKKVYNESKKTIFFSIIMMIVCFFVVKRRRLYECVVWGGAAGTLFGILTFGMIFFSRNGLFYGIRQMVFYEDYMVFFSGEDMLTKLIPGSLALKMFLVYGAVIAAGLIVTIVVRIISRHKSQPHKF